MFNQNKPYNYNALEMQNFNPFSHHNPSDYKYPKDIFNGFISAGVCSDVSLRKPHVYLLHHPGSDLVYIGGTKNVRERMLKHKLRLRTNKHHSKILQAEYDKDDWIEFYVKPVRTKEEAHKFEQELLDKYFGKEYILNTAPNSLTQEGLIHTPETIAKMTATRNTPEMLEMARLVNLGRPNTPEQKAKISAALKGKPCPDHVKQLNSELFKGVPRTDDVKANIKKGILAKIDPVSCDGVIYESVAEASRQLGVGHSTILHRVGNVNKPTWFRIPKDQLNTVV